MNWVFLLLQFALQKSQIFSIWGFLIIAFGFPPFHTIFKMYQRSHLVLAYFRVFFPTWVLPCRGLWCGSLLLCFSNTFTMFFFYRKLNASISRRQMLTTTTQLKDQVQCLTGKKKENKYKIKPPWIEVLVENWTNSDKIDMAVHLKSWISDISLQCNTSSNGKNQIFHQHYWAIQM